MESQNTRTTKITNNVPLRDNTPDYVNDRKTHQVEKEKQNNKADIIYSLLTNSIVIVGLIIFLFVAAIYYKVINP